MNLSAPLRPTSAQRWPGSGLPLAFWAARHHPEASARRAIAGALARWAGLAPDALTADVTDWSPPETHPPVTAPFVAEAHDHGDTAALARLLFSPRVAGSRLRLASRDALLGQYGITITPSGRGYASARHLDRVPRHAAHAVAYLHPRALSGIPVELLATGRRARPDAVATVSASGIVVVVRNVRWSAAPPDLAGRLAQSSVVIAPDGRRFSLPQLGLLAHVEHQAVHVRPRTGEAAIRLTALMARGARLVLTPGERDDGARMRVVARLAPPAEGGTPLLAVASDPMPELDAWLRLRWEDEPALPFDLRLLLARHLLPHDSWLDSDLIEALLTDSMPNNSTARPGEHASPPTGGDT